MERRSERIFGQRYGGNRPIRMADLNAHLMCVLCCGYYIDATTIIECLHSFCRACIVQYLEKSSRCPVCNIVVHKAQPLLNIRLDHVLQGLVYKLVPGLLMKEMNDRRSFYSRGLPSKAKGQAKETTLTSSILTSSTLSDQSGQKLTTSTKPASADSECFSISLEYCPRFKLVPCFDENVKNTSDINGQFIDVRYLLCPAAFTVGCLKKFIRAKFDLPLVYQVHILYNDEYLDNHLSMLDIAFIFQWQKRAPLKLFYSVSSTPKTKRKFSNEIPFEDQDETSPKKQNKSMQTASSSHCDHSPMPLSSSLEKRVTQSSTRSVQTDSLQRMSGVAGLKVVEHAAGVFPKERLLDSNHSTKDVHRNHGKNSDTNQELSKSNPKTVRSTCTGELTVNTAHGNVDAIVVHEPADGRLSHNAVKLVSSVDRKGIRSEKVKQPNPATNTTTSDSSDAEFVIDLTQDGTDSPVSVVAPPRDSIVGPNALSTANCSVSNSHMPAGSIGFLGDNCTALYGGGGGTWGMNLSQLAEKSFAALPCISAVNSMNSLSCGLQNHLPYGPSSNSLMPGNAMKILTSPEMAIVPSFGVQILYSDALISPSPIYGVVRVAGAPATAEFDPVAQGRSWGQDDLTENGIMNDADFQRLCEGKSEQEKNLLYNTRQYGQLMISTVLDRAGRDATQVTPASCTLSSDPSTSVPLPCMFTAEGSRDQQNCWGLFEPFKANDRTLWDISGSAMPDLKTAKSRTIPVESAVSESSGVLFPLKTSRELQFASNAQAQLKCLESGDTDVVIDVHKSSGMAKSCPLELGPVNVWGKERSTSDVERTKTCGSGIIGLHVDCTAGDTSGSKPESGRSTVLEQPTVENPSAQSYLQEHRHFEQEEDNSKLAKACTVQPSTRSDSCASGQPKADVFEEVSVQLLPVCTSSGVAGTEIDGLRAEEGTTLITFEASSVKSSVASPTELEIVDARIQSSVVSHLVDKQAESSAENVQKWAKEESQVIVKVSRFETEPDVRLVESNTDMILNSDDVVAVETSIETAHKETGNFECLADMTRIAPVELEVEEPKVFKLETCSVKNITAMESDSIEIPEENACLLRKTTFEGFLPVGDEVTSSADNCSGPFVQEAKNENSEDQKLCKKEIKEFQICDYSETVLQSLMTESPVSKREELTLDDQSIDGVSSPVTDEKNVTKEVPDLFSEPNVTLTAIKLKELDDSVIGSCCLTRQITTDSQVERSEENGDQDLQGFSCGETISGSSLPILVSDTIPVSLSSSNCCHVVNVNLRNPHCVFDSVSAKDLVLQTPGLEMSEAVPPGNKLLAFCQSGIESVSDVCNNISTEITERIPMPKNLVELERENAFGLSGNEMLSVCENLKTCHAVNLMEQQDAHEIEFDCMPDGSCVKEEAVDMNKMPVSDIMEDVSAHDASDCTCMSLEVSLLIDQKQESMVSDNSDKLLQNKSTFANESEESERNIIAENEISGVGPDVLTSFMSINSPISADENCNEMSSVGNLPSSAIEMPNSVVPLNCPVPCSTNSPNVNDFTCELPASSVIDAGDQIMGSNVLFIIDDCSDLDSSKIFPHSTVSGNDESIFLSSDNMSETVLSTSTDKALPMLCADSLILQSLQNCVNEAVISSLNNCVDIVQVETASKTAATDCILLTLEDASPSQENSFEQIIEPCEADTVDVIDDSCIRNDSELPLCDNEDGELCKANVDLVGSQSEGFSLINVLEFCGDTQTANTRNDSGSGSLYDEINKSSADDLDYCNLKLSHCFQFTQTEDGELDERCITNDDMDREETNRLNLQRIDRLDSCFSTISRSASFGSFQANASSDAAFNLRVKRRRWNSVDEGMFAKRRFIDGDTECIINPLPAVKLQQDKEIKECDPFIQSTVTDKTVGGSLPSIAGCDSEDKLLMSEDVRGLASFCEGHGQISVILHDVPPLDFAGEISAAGKGILANNCSNLCCDSCEFETDLQDHNEKSHDLDFSESMKTGDKIVSQNPGI